MEKGCGRRCMKPRDKCNHRCQEECHPGKPCPDTPCEAEMRHFCKCGHRYIITICKSIEDRQPLECNPDCWKQQREKRMATAFGSSKDFNENKAGIQIEYYPESVIELCKSHPKFAAKTEEFLSDVVFKKTSRSFNNLTGEKRNFVMQYVYEHFKLDMCTYGGKSGNNSIAVTDVYWKEGCRVPDMLATEVLQLM